jgi:hypothetical protein
MSANVSTDKVARAATPNANAAPWSTDCATPSPPTSNADVNVYELNSLLGHASLATSQRYIDGAGQETRAAAARNPLDNKLT